MLTEPPLVTDDGVDTSGWPQKNLIVAISSDRGLCGGEEKEVLRGKGATSILSMWPSLASFLLMSVVLSYASESASKRQCGCLAESRDDDYTPPSFEVVNVLIVQPRACSSENGRSPCIKEEVKWQIASREKAARLTFGIDTNLDAIAQPPAIEMKRVHAHDAYMFSHFRAFACVSCHTSSQV